MVNKQITQKESPEQKKKVTKVRGDQKKERKEEKIAP